MFYRRLLVALALFGVSCGGTNRNAGAARYAVLRFENLTGDRGNDWMGRAASQMLIQQLAAIPYSALRQAAQPFTPHSAAAPGVSAEATEARLAGATRLVTGYLEMHGGRPRFTAVEEDAATGKTVRTGAAEGPVLASVAAIAKQFGASPRAFPTASEAALRAYASGVEAPDSGGTYFPQAIAADPKFAEPYVAWAESAAARGDRATVQRVLEQAQQQSLGEPYLAKLELLDATVAGDAAARERALSRLVTANPADGGAAKALADSQFAAHRFPEAAGNYAKIAGPQNAEAYNQVAYARMFGGDEKGALAAVQQYRDQRPQDPNALDSRGDIEFYFGRFEQAEKSYLAAADKDAEFNQGLETWKAARARWMTGDAGGAFEIFARYRDAREKAKDVSLPFRVAEWQYLTGARADALDKMRKLADAGADANLKALALAQAAIWELRAGRRADAIRDSDAAMKGGQTPSLAASAMVRFSAERPGSAAELRARAESTFHGPAMGPVRELAVAYALWFAGNYREAATAWQAIYQATNPNDQSAAFLYAGAVKESRGETLPLLSANPIPPVTLNPTFECLYFPQLVEWRGDHALYLKLGGSTAAPIK